MKFGHAFLLPLQTLDRTSPTMFKVFQDINSPQPAPGKKLPQAKVLVKSETQTPKLMHVATRNSNEPNPLSINSKLTSIKSQSLPKSQNVSIAAVPGKSDAEKENRGIPRKRQSKSRVPLADITSIYQEKAVKITTPVSVIVKSEPIRLQPSDKTHNRPNTRSMTSISQAGSKSGKTGIMSVR